MLHHVLRLFNLNHQPFFSIIVKLGVFESVLLQVAALALYLWTECKQFALYTGHYQGAAPHL